MKHQASLAHYDFAGQMAPVLQSPAPVAPADLGIALQTAIDDYVAENKRAGSWQTVNGYIRTFQSFFEWAMKNGHVEANLFAGTRVGKFNSKAVPKRQAYKPDALKAVYREVTENNLGMPGLRRTP